MLNSQTSTILKTALSLTGFTMRFSCSICVSIRIVCKNGLSNKANKPFPDLFEYQSKNKHMLERYQLVLPV